MRKPLSVLALTRLHKIGNLTVLLGTWVSKGSTLPGITTPKGFRTAHPAHTEDNIRNRVSGHDKGGSGTTLPGNHGGHNCLSLKRLRLFSQPHHSESLTITRYHQRRSSHFSLQRVSSGLPIGGLGVLTSSPCLHNNITSHQ